MAILENVLIGPNQKEQVDPENEGLLYRIDEVYFKKFLMENVPWHWHPFLEFACVKEGDVEYSFAEKKVLLQKGDAIFINSNVFHATKPTDREKRGKFTVILFDHRFLCGGYHSNLERSYFLPLMASGAVPFYVFKAGEPLTEELTEIFDDVVEADHDRAFGYEFAVQNRMAKLWLRMLREWEPLLQKKIPKTSVGIECVRSMMLFISENYAEKLTLDEIAVSAAISRRECCRCFRTVLGMTPTDYLTQYRLDAATQLLLNTSKTILEISEECGFSSASYFSKAFLKNMGYTPKSFRRRGEGSKEKTES